jgi:hypothetical protein
VDIRIGVTNAPREINIELEDDEGVRSALKAAVDGVLSGASAVLWVTDKKGRDIAVPAERIAYVEIGSAAAERRIGFGG